MKNQKENIPSLGQAEELPEPSVTEVADAPEPVIAKPRPKAKLRQQTPVDMPLANARLIIGLESSTCPLRNITPAEALTLVILHMPGAKKFPIVQLEECGSVKRTLSQEFNRLKGKYGAKKLKAIFGVRPQFPDNFDDAFQMGTDNVEEGGIGDGENPVWAEQGLPTPNLMTASLGG